MVITIDGAPVNNQKVAGSLRSTRRASVLPKIPHSGPTALLSSDVLVSRVEEITWAGQRRRQQRLPLSITSLRDSQYSSPKDFFQQRSIVHNLHKTDHAHAPRFLDSLLVSCQQESSASLAVDKVGELAISQKLDDELISNATFETTLNGASLENHHMPPSAVISPRVRMISEQAVRNHHLKDSFRNSLKEIASRLTEMEKHLHVCAAIGTSAPSAQQSQKIMHDLFFSPRAFSHQRSSEKDTSLSEDVHTVLPQVLRAFERSAIDAIAPKIGQHNRSCGKDEIGLIATSASIEEITLATDLLNFLRWLCGLGPVSLNENCIRTCQAVAQSLLPRAALFLKPSSSQFVSIKDFASLLAEFISPKSRCMILHGEASLLEAVLQCLLTCASPVDDAYVVSPTSRTNVSRDNLIHDVCRRAEQYRKEIRDDSKKLSQPAFFFPQAAHEVIDSKSLPPALADFNVLWLLVERRLCDFRHSSRVPRLQRPISQQVKDQHRLRKSPRQLPRTRAIAWSQEQEQKEQAKKAAYWGDRDERILFRRYLLNPALESFGASRSNDTCALWTAAESVPCGGEDNYSTHLGTRSPRPQEYPRTSRDIICFPPPGFFPHEYLLGAVPTWTIMPNGQIYQPTQSLSVRMWRVYIEGSGAERIAEIPMSSFFCDCSAKGNPFCIFFQPQIQRIADGDQFEVEVSGLRGCDTKLHIFHDFRSFSSEHLDSELLTAAEAFCSMLENVELWREPQRLISGNEHESSSFSRISRRTLHSRVTLQDANRSSTLLSPPLDSCQSPTTMGAECPLELPEIGLITHPALAFTTEVVDICMSVRCNGAKALQVQLHLVRASGNEEVRHATWVVKCAQNFIIKVKLPMSQCKYELSFKVSLPCAPDVMLNHPLKYRIFASEACQNLLIAMDHPSVEKFGYAFQSHLVQVHDVSVIAPVLYRVRTGYMNFLVYVGPEAYSQHEHQSAHARFHTSLFTSRLAPDESNKAPTANQEQLARGGCHSAEPASCIVTTFQNILKPSLESVVQDVRDAIHIDISVLQKNAAGASASLGQRYVKRLQRRSDLPEFYHGLLWFSENEANCVVEMFLRFPSAQAAQYAPLKIGEWMITRKEEEFPIGF